MSIIIGYKANGKIYMATDTQRRMGNYYYSDLTETGLNVFRLPHGVLCGVSNYGAKQIIQTHTYRFEDLDDEPLTKKFIVQNIIPNFYDLCNDRKLIREDKKQDGRLDFDGSVLLAQNDRLFCIDNDFTVLTIPKFCLIGSAADYAFARVLSHKDDTSVEKMLYSAISDAQIYSKTVRKPYFVFSTDSQEKKLLGGEDSCLL